MGYLLVGGLYLLLAAPQSPWLGSDLPTNALLRWLDQPAEPSLDPSNLILLSDAGGNLAFRQQAFWGNAWMASELGFAGVGQGVSARVRIGHWLWTILFGMAGGWTAARVGRGPNRSAKTQLLDDPASGETVGASRDWPHEFALSQRRGKQK